MATRWRLHFDGDNIYTEKELRVHKLTEDVEDKIAHIPEVVNDLGSDSETDALSAKMGKVLYDQVTSLSWTWKFLSAWDCTTWLPLTNPQVDPYTYTVGDYYVVSAIGTTNYKPHWGTFTQWVPSTAVETENVWVNDKYYFDWASRTRIPDTAIQVGIDSALSTTSTNAVENRVVTNALNQKQWIISDLAAIRSWAAAGSTALQRLANISELTNNLGYQTAWDVATAIAWKANTSDLNALDWRVTTAEGKISTLETSSADYASRISSLETSSWGASQDIAGLQGDVTSIQGDITSIEGDISSLQGSVSSLQGTVNGHTISISNLQGDVSSLQTTVAWKANASDVNTKTFYLANDQDLTTAQAAYDWYLVGKNPIIIYNNRVYTIKSYTVTSPGQPGWGGRDDEEEVVWQEYALLFAAPGIETSWMTLWDYLINFAIVWNVADIMIYYQQKVGVLSTGNTTSYTPSWDYNPATKKYVDDIVGDIETLLANL